MYITELWDPEDGLFYDHLHHSGKQHILRIQSVDSLVPIFACKYLTKATLDRHPRIKAELQRLLAERKNKDN